MRYGLEGYGLYWYCLELIASGVDKSNLTFELDHDSEILAHDLSMHIDKISDIMGYMVKLGLFENIDGIITCLSLARRADEYTAKAIKVTLKSINTPDSVGILSGPKETKLEETKLEEKKKEIKPTIPLPEFISDEQWTELQAIKKKATKVTLTDRAKTQLINGLTKIIEAGYTIEQVLNIWSEYPNWKTITLEYMRNKCAPLPQNPVTSRQVTTSEEYTDEERAEINEKLKKLNA